MISKDRNIRKEPQVPERYEYKEKDNKEDEPFTLLNLLKSIVNGVFKLISVAVRPIGDAVDTMIVNPSMRKRYSYVQL